MNKNLASTMVTREDALKRALGFDDFERALAEDDFFESDDEVADMSKTISKGLAVGTLSGSLSKSLGNTGTPQSLSSAASFRQAGTSVSLGTNPFASLNTQSVPLATSSGALESWEEEKQNLLKELTTLKTRFDGLSDQNKRNIALIQKKLNTAIDQRDDLVEELLDEIMKLDDSVGKEFSERYDDIKKGNVTSATQSASLEAAEEVIALKSVIIAKEDEIKELTSRLASAALSTNPASSLSGASAMPSLPSEEVEALQAKVNELEPLLQSTQAKLETLKNKHKEKMKSVQEQFETMKAYAMNLIEEKEKEIVELKANSSSSSSTLQPGSSNPTTDQIVDSEEFKKLQEENKRLLEELSSLSAKVSSDASKTTELEELQKALEASKNDQAKQKEKYEKKLKSAMDQFETMKAQALAMVSSREDELQASQAELEIVRNSVASAAAELAAARAEASEAQQRMEEMGARLRKEMLERKRLFNQVQELKGNIRVFCRSRPPLPFEMEQENSVCVSFPEEGEITVTNSKKLEKSWEFDYVFSPKHTNSDVFNEVEGLVVSALDGYNVCIFAYGQTGSGKTHTMEGSPENPGLNIRTLNKLFDLLSERKDTTYSFSVSLLEIYNETIRDMLQPRGDGKWVIREGPNGIFVQDLTLAQVASPADVLAIMQQGYSNRVTFSTNMNEHSSRSHAVLTIYIEGKNNVTGQQIRGKLNLIDLAGSERVGKSGATGDRLKEAQAINKSLSALGDVIQARMEKRNHVPFRNSTLTHLLSDSLSGDSKTLMFVNISPVLSNAEETFCSLNFASRVRNVELGQAKKNVVPPPIGNKS